MPSFIESVSRPKVVSELTVHITTAPKECCGCPSDSKCAMYCRNQYGSQGGYCEGFLDLRCKCV